MTPVARVVLGICGGAFVFFLGVLIAGAAFGACNENSEGDTGCAIADSFPFAVLITLLPAFVVLAAAAVLKDWFWRVVGCVLALQVAAFFVVFSLP